MGKIVPGTVYEIKLENEKFAYVCRFDEFNLGLFNVISDNQVNIETLLLSNLIDYKACGSINKIPHLKDEKIRKFSWKIIGEIDLIKYKISIPDLAIYNPWKKELSYKNCQIARHGHGKIKVSAEEYKKLLDKGLTDGYIDNFMLFEKYINNNIDNILNNKPLDPSGFVSTFGDE